MPAKVPMQRSEPVPSADAIVEVSLERRCFGCDREVGITVRRDGTATRVAFGNARMGTSDRQAGGTITKAAFDDLARRIDMEKFFDLNDEYRDPQIADGEWTVTTVIAQGRRKSIIDRNKMAPPALLRIQASIDALSSTVAWKEIAHIANESGQPAAKGRR